MVAKETLLIALPAVQGKKNVIEHDQTVKHIIGEVIEAHKYFTPDYRKIARYFNGGSAEAIGRRLFDFCKSNIRYQVEPESSQSTRSPGALLAMGRGDCKHYAGFIAGVLDAIGGMDWKYRFASYDLFNGEPGHVFIVINDGGREIWVDPVLDEFDQRTPAYFSKRDKKVSNMALSRIYGIGRSAAAAGIPAYVSHARVSRSQLTPARLGLPGQYYPSDYYNPLYAAYQAKVLGGGAGSVGSPVRFFVDGELYDLPSTPAYKLREQGLNIPLVPQGLTVEYPPLNFLGKPVPADLLRPFVTADRTMVITTPSGALDMKAPADYQLPFGVPASARDQFYTTQILVADDNRLLRLVMFAAGAIQLAYQPYPDAENLQRWTHRVLDLRLNNNYLVPMEIKTVAGSFFEGIANAVEAVGKGFVKFIGIIPRTAFLQLLRVNVKNMAENLYNNLSDPNKAAEIRKKWEGFGGEYKMLYNAAKDGSVKKALGKVGEPITATTAVAALAAAAPIIALLAKFLKGIGGPEVDAFVDESVGKMNDLFIKAGLDPISVGDAMGGKPVIVVPPGGGQVTIPPPPKSGLVAWVQDNPVLAAGAGAAVVMIGMGAARKGRR